MIEGLGGTFLQAYNYFLSGLPLFFQKFINLFVIVLLIVLYSIFIWKFYRSVSSKNIMILNLNKYNKSDNSFNTKFLAGFFYVLEYIVIMPVLVFLWFSVFTLLLIFMTDNLEVSTLLLISATIIAAIRMASYYKEDLARDVAKLIPFTFLAVSLLNPTFFSIERIMGQFSQIPIFFSEIFIYLFFIIFIEVVLRFFSFIFSLFELENPIEEEEETNKK